jgi:tRNA-splicing ligase RtcB (3'-phosphate/5'-hydroxy nucleic acid ligase)
MTKKIYNYGINLDKRTIKQFEKCYSEKFVISAALMPDAHLGYSAPIGSVLKTKGFVVPAWVGFDIGCGMIAIRIMGSDLVEDVFEKRTSIYNAVSKKIPMGVGDYNTPKNITKKTKKEFDLLLEKFEKGSYNKNILNYLKTASLKHLGTLGGGNHFIELGSYKKELWLVIHSGSRGIGHTVGKKYMVEASGSNKKEKFEKTSPLDVNSDLGKEYLNVLKFGLDYALLNRLEIAYKFMEILNKITGKNLKYSMWVNKNHNHAIYEEGHYIHRKGATPARKKEKGVIPGNMRDGTFLVEGKGNPKFLSSSSHGAGRKISISKAKEKFKMKDFQKTMQGIKGTINQKTLSESPMAYKDIFKVINAQKQSIKVLKHLKPIINWKG